MSVIRDVHEMWAKGSAEGRTNSLNGPSVTHPPPPPVLIMFGLRPGCASPVYFGSGAPLPPMLDAFPLNMGEWMGSWA